MEIVIAADIHRIQKARIEGPTKVQARKMATRRQALLAEESHISETTWACLVIRLGGDL